MMSKKIKIIILILVLLILSGCALVKFFYKVKEPETINRPEAVPVEEILRRKIDGLPVKSETEANLYPVAIMIENSADAWPLTGLNKAQLVYEAITEASIPRFVALFATNEKIDKIGPVRSARPYYLDWIEPFAPIYMHVGGAPEALAKIRSGSYDLLDMDQFFHSQYYWRDKWRYAPHNVYTSSELIQQMLADKEAAEPIDYPMWQYKNDLALENRPEDVNDITIKYTSDYYRVDWRYNREDNNYIRYQHQALQKLSDGEWVKAKNIIVQVNDMSIIDNVGRKNIQTLGEGHAWVFRDGQVIEGKWVKETKEQRVKYFDGSGQEIQFNGGTTWVEIIPDADYLQY